jgi:predicted RNA-binding Zn-ribbon protein involved in translation (DUF1610 family)
VDIALSKALLRWDETLPDEEKLHKHRCPRCGHTWKHGEHCAGSREAHTCGQCGAQAWLREPEHR